MANILLTSVGNDGAQAIMAALRKPGCAHTLIGADASPHAYGLKMADVGYIIPFRREEAALLERLQHIISQQNVDLVLPLSTEDQYFYAKHAALLEKKGCKVQHSPLKSIEIANNKHLLLAFLQNEKVSVPAFRLVHNREQLELALRDFGVAHQPVVIKQEFSTGASGVKIVLPDQLGQNRIFDRDNIRVPLGDLLHWLDTAEKTMPAANEAASKPMPNDIFPLQVSEFLPDARYSVDIFLINGKAQVAAVRTEDARFYGASLRGVTIADAAVKKLGVNAAEALDLCGTVNVEIGRDNEGQPKVMEINPRFPASIDHTVAAGCNMPLWTVQTALGFSCALCEPKIGLHYLRCWQALTFE